MNGKIILFLSLVCCSLAASDRKKCQKSGAYCLNHWDCCSNTCLSFLYKCSFIPSSDINPSSRDVSSAPAIPAQPAALPAVVSDTVSYETMLDDIFNPVKNEPTSDGNELNSIKSRSGDKTNRDKLQNDISNDSVEPKCSEYGSECYTGNECCSKQCHRYLFRCVTPKFLD